MDDNVLGSIFKIEGPDFSTLNCILILELSKNGIKAVEELRKIAAKLHTVELFFEASNMINMTINKHSFVLLHYFLWLTELSDGLRYVTKY